MRISSITKNAGKACNNRLYRHIRTFEKIVKNYFVIYTKPTVEETGRKVSKHSKANNYDWAMPEELNGNVSKKGELPKNCREATGILEADLTVM